jgi:hypothetical protein
MKIQTDIKIAVLITAILISSCTATGKISVTNVNDSNSLQEASFIYALPLTVYDIHIVAEEEIFTPGPYAKYAEKYLGIKNAISRPVRQWTIKSVNLSHHIEVDPDYLYIVRNIQNSDSNPGLTRMLNDSIILDLKRFSTDLSYRYTNSPETNKLLYTDLSVKRNFEAEKDIEVSVVLPDTNYNADKIGKFGLKEKTPEQKAEEAANFIIKLKKRRFKLVAGQYDYMPEGEAMGEALKELARIEGEYLSLFTGKILTRVVERDYHYTPPALKETDRPVIFRFSEGEGFLNARETTGIPAILETQTLNKLKGLRSNSLPLKAAGDLLQYRIADEVSVKLTVGEILWAEAIYPVFQSGVIVPLNLNTMLK